MTTTRLTHPLAAVLAALFVFQILHGAAPSPPDAPEEGALAGTIGGLGFIAMTGVAWFGVRKGRDRARRLAGVVGLAIPIGFVLYHGAWFDSPITNPYWGDGSASGWQWASVVAVGVTGLAAAALARAGVVTPPAPAPARGRVRSPGAPASSRAPSR